jgi:adenylosuccinate synthase
MITVIIGAQWGDEGKAKFIDYLSSKFDIVARYGGGANAGHTVNYQGQKYIFHLVPSGLLHAQSEGLIGNGVVLDFDYFQEEIADLEKRGLDVLSRLYLSDAMHLILPFHKILDKAGESLLGDNKIGTTGRGIGPAYEDKMSRRGLRLGDLHKDHILRDKLAAIWEFKTKQLKDLYGMEVDFGQEELYDKLSAFYQKVKGRIVNGSYFLTERLKQGQKVLLEGAQATCLDIDHGTYPFVTSSNPTIGGALAGIGVGPQWVERIVGIAKAYTTRVGSGPFPTEETGEIGEAIREQGQEYGATTGRPRRCGWIDLEALRMAVRVNGLTELAIAKLDVLNEFDTIKLGVGYKLNGQKIDCFPSYGLDEVEPVYDEMPGWREDITEVRSFDQLPANAQSYLERIEQELGIPVRLLGVGPDRDATLAR